MNYHNILHDDMRNGVGLRVTLFVSGCSNKCEGCQNPQTWDEESGIQFDINAWNEILETLQQPYINGITFSGGDPLHDNNIGQIYKLCKEIKTNYKNKTIWLYTGYTLESIWDKEGSVRTNELDVKRLLKQSILQYIDVLVDGKFVQELADVNYHWAGSTNQRVIDVQKTLQSNTIILFEN